MAVEEPLRLGDREHGCDRPGVLGLDLGEVRRLVADESQVRAAIRMLDFASVISRLSISARKNGHAL